MMKQITLLIIMVIFSGMLYAQDYRQTVKGKIIDKESHTPVEFATILLTNTTFSSGTISNETGDFKIENVPVGRIALQVSFVGYESVTISNLEVTTGKELIVNIELIESAVKLEKVTIKAHHNKKKPLNSLTTISARTFSIEESQRYAGSWNDVSRMAMNFAGVKASSDIVNEIVIRGNTPIGLLFRLEGVDIPNPNHFGDGGTTGGPISMLNNNTLSNSDFLTGAFPAEYGNTISGVFDLRMRTGNNDNHEFVSQVGFRGLELGAEGPISSKNNSSYLINYRYSTLQILSGMGVDLGTGAAIPKYQDISFKLNFPSRKIGNISLFGLGGKSNMKMLDSERDTTLDKEEMPLESDYEMDLYMDNYNGVIGLTHSYILGNSAYTKFILSASTISNIYTQDSLSTVSREPFLQYYTDFQRTKYAARFFVNKKLDSKNTLRTGISVEQQVFNLLDSIYEGSSQIYRTIRDFDGNDMIIQPYIQYQHRFNDKLRINLGVNTIFQTSNQNYTIEPRVGLKWELVSGNTISFGYGLHSINTPIEIANQKVRLEDGTYIEPNTDLDFTKSHHFIIGYDKVFSGKIRFKSEIYYQYITNVVVEKDSSSYSLLNRGAYTFTDADILENTGKGYNYGIELTIEKFMDRGLYFLSTLSLYESKYRGSDGVLRNTAFNSNYVFNLLVGKEFKIKSKKENACYVKKFVIDGKFNLAGGQHYSPIDLEASGITGITQYDESNAYSKQIPAYFKIDLRLAMKWVGKKSTQELAIDISNLTNRENPFYVKYDPETGNLKTINQFGLMPELLYRITF